MTWGLCSPKRSMRFRLRRIGHLCRRRDKLTPLDQDSLGADKVSHQAELIMGPASGPHSVHDSLLGTQSMSLPMLDTKPCASRK